MAPVGVNQSVHDLEGTVAIAAEAEDGEMVIESRRAQDAEPLHHREARPVDDREVLIGKALSDRERDFEVRRGDRLEGRRVVHHGPVPLGAPTAEPVREQEPCLDDHVVTGDETFAGPEDLLRANVVAVVGVGSRVEDRRIDEERQLAASTASPT